MRYPEPLQLFRRFARFEFLLHLYFGTCRLRSAPSVCCLCSIRYSGVGSVLFFIMDCVRILCSLVLYRHVFCGCLVTFYSFSYMSIMQSYFFYLFVFRWDAL